MYQIRNNLYNLDTGLFVAYSLFFCPTQVILGENSINRTGLLLRQHGAHRVLVVTGRNKVLTEKVLTLLKDHKLVCQVLDNVQPNPRISLARKGIALAREMRSDFILAVGGGSVMDTAKCISCGALYEGDVTDLYHSRQPQKRIPVGCIVTRPGSSSEVSNSSVMNLDEGPQMEKLDMISDLAKPVLAILDPVLSTSLSPHETALSSFDMMMHSLERYLNGKNEFNITDSLVFSIVRNIITQTQTAMKDPSDLKARSELLWTSSLSHCGLTSMGYEDKGDWACHQIEYTLSALLDIPHAAGLSIIFTQWLDLAWERRPQRLAKLSEAVFGFSDAPRCFRKLIADLCLPMHLSEIGKALTENDIQRISSYLTKDRRVCIGSYITLDHDDIRLILSNSL